MDGSKPGDLVLDGQYELLEQIKGSVGEELRYVGSEGACRFCGQSGESRFRKIAHTFPEALGNRWVVSRDECDSCNDAFSVYESALVAAMSSVLTLGGVRGKTSRTRQTGRSAGARVLSHSVIDGQRSLAVICNDLGLDGIEPQWTPGGLFRMKLPVAATPFRPRFAYKAIVKMGLSLLPDEELANYQRLRAWILDAGERSLFPSLDVALSFASIGNSPELVCGTLLRRVNRSAPIPRILFIFCAGSVCFQVALMSDRLDGHSVGRSNLRWQSVVLGEEGQSLVFDYGDPVHRDWSSHDSEPQPIDFFWLEFNPTTCEASLTPVFR